MNGKSSIPEVLIIDDELDICILLSSILLQNNFYAKYVTSLHDARIILGKENPDVIVLDNHLPDGRGLDFIPVLKHNYSQDKIIMISAFDGKDENKKAIESGALDFISKPFTKEDIIHTIEKAVALGTNND